MLHICYFVLMKILSINVSEPKKITFNGKELITSIYKIPVNKAVNLIAGFNDLPLLHIGLCIRLSISYHLLNVVVRKSTGAANDDVLLLSRSLVLGRYVENTIGIDIKRDLDLGNAARSRGDTNEVELAKILVINGHLTLSLQRLNLYLGLIVHGSGECLLFLGGDRSVSRNELGHHASEGLNAETERGDIKEENILHISLEDAALDGGAHRHDLVRVDTTAGLFPKEIFDRLLNLRHSGHAANQNDLMDVRLGKISIFNTFLFAKRRKDSEKGRVN